MPEIVDKLLSQLDADRTDLLRGDFRKVLAAQEQRAAAVEALSGESGLTIDRLHALKFRASRNSTLLRAAVQGFRDANRRRDAVAKPLTTYSAMGGRRAHANGHGGDWDRLA